MDYNAFSSTITGSSLRKRLARGVVAQANPQSSIQLMGRQPNLKVVTAGSANGYTQIKESPESGQTRGAEIQKKMLGSKSLHMGDIESTRKMLWIFHLFF